jgi:hypothetical protein
MIDLEKTLIYRSQTISLWPKTYDRKAGIKASAGVSEKL